MVSVTPNACARPCVLSVLYEQYTPEVGLDRAAAIRGIIIAMRNKNLDSSFRIMNAVDDDIFTAQYPFNSPLLKDIKILQKWRLHDGHRRSRRAKLYYLVVSLRLVPSRASAGVLTMFPSVVV